MLAGKEYGSGSSRDWAAKGTALLGVKAVIAESYERIHRSNLIGMGVLPLQFPGGKTADDMGLTGEETISISGVTELNDGTTPRTVTVKIESATASAPTSSRPTVRIDTPGEANYYRNGGIMQYVLRNLLRADAAVSTGSPSGSRTATEYQTAEVSTAAMNSANSTPAGDGRNQLGEVRLWTANTLTTRAPYAAQPRRAWASTRGS